MKRRLKSAGTCDGIFSDPKNVVKDQSDGISCAEALRNPLILNRIFSNLSTKFLLSTCSLVSKSWNTEARKFTRDHRTCQILNGGWKNWGEEFISAHHVLPEWTPRGLKRVCEFVRQVDELCCKITECGRIVPYNSLEFFVNSCRFRSGNSSSVLYRPLEWKSQSLKLEHLKINWCYLFEPADCKVHQTLKALLHQACPELRRLELQYLSFNFENEFQDCFPQFPKLEELVFENVPVVRGEEAQVKQKKILRRLLQGCPNLKKLRARGRWAIESIPEEKYGLLHSVEFNYDIDNSQDWFRQLLRARPPLTELNILHFSSAIYREPSSDDKLLQQLLQFCHQSLETIYIDGVCLLGKLTFPTLVNLTRLKLTSPTGVCEGLWTLLTSIDFQGLMPRLEEVQVRILVTNGPKTVYKEVLLWPDPSENWNRDGITPVCSSVKKLKLQVEARNLNLDLLKSVFPNVLSLGFKVDKNLALEKDIMQISEVCQVWPDLEELEIMGDYNYLERCCDADFCGIHPHEAQGLVQMSDEFLKLVHIVPIKPSLLTMQKLRSLRVHFKFDDHSLDNPDIDFGNHEQNFISNVTRLIALRGIPQASISAVFTPEGTPYV